MKKLCLILVGLLLVPSISFAQTTVSRETLLAEIAQLQAELNALLEQTSSSQSLPIETIMPAAPVMEIVATTTPSNEEVCTQKTNYWGRPYLSCQGG